MSWEDELKKELTELMFAYYEHGANMHTIIPDADAKPILNKVHSLLKQAKIEENKRSIEMFLSLPESNFSDLDIADILRRRNSELEGEIK